MGCSPHLPPYYLSAYALAQRRGFKGSLDEWLESLTAYGLACSLGFTGSKEAWLESLKVKGDPGKSAYQYAVEAGYTGTEEAFAQGMGNPGKTAFEYAQDGGYTGTLEEFNQMLATEHLALAGGTMKGAIDMAGFAIANVGAPVEDGDVAPKSYVEEHVKEEIKTTKDEVDKTLTDYVTKSGDTMTGPLNLPAPTEDAHAANKSYVDGKWGTVSITLSAAGWTNNQQTVSVTGVTADTTKTDVWASPDPADENYIAYNESGVRLYAQLDGAVTFKCEDVPGIDLIVSVSVRR